MGFKKRLGKGVALAAFPALLAGLVVTTVLLRVQLGALFASPENLRRWVASTGVVAPLVFAAVQAFQVIVFFIPGEIPQVAGGYLFGLWKGTLLSLAGISLGALFNFAISRSLGVAFVHALFSRDKVGRVRRIADAPRAKLSFFLFFLVPGIPKDVLCYVAGLSTMRLSTFFLFSTLGRVPGIMGSALVGDAAADRRWILAGTVLFVAVVLFLVGFFLREPLQRLIERLSRHRAGGGSRRPPQA